MSLSDKIELAYNQKILTIEDVKQFVNELKDNMLGLSHVNNEGIRINSYKEFNLLINKLVGNELK